MTVVTLRDFTPPARYDTLPWTQARMQESANGSTGWTTIETFSFIEIDPDPKDPATRSFTSENGTLATGWYRIQWVDGSGDTEDSDPVPNIPLPPWAPSVRDIAAKLRARTKTPGGDEAGDFTSHTRPTADQVEDLIRDAVNKVTMIVGDTPSTRVASDARALASLYAAMNVEISYFPEQIERGASPFNAMERMYKQNVADLYKLLYPDTGSGGDGEIPPGADVLMPSFAYPEDAGGMGGWQSRW
jgi:hypothetical protein